MVTTELVKMSSKKQDMYTEEHSRRTKSEGVAYFLWFVFRVHYIYLGKVGWQFVYWFTLGGLIIWAIVDLFRIPDMVIDYNKDISIEILRDIKTLSSEDSNQLITINDLIKFNFIVIYTRYKNFLNNYIIPYAKPLVGHNIVHTVQPSDSGGENQIRE